ncbi:MAG: insulinase family protein, partial [Rikenellaceae bacterium]|nr:insulinase family protein [Rikenellaceae bacterium]
PEPEFTAPVVKEVWGVDAQNVALAWRTDAPTTEDYYMVPLVSSILYNGQAGLIDMNINQQQKTLVSYAMHNHLSDYGFIGVAGMPKQGQTLEEVADLLLKEVDKLRNGEFSEELIAATVANFKAGRMNEFDSNDGRGHFYVESFSYNQPLEDAFAQLDNMSKVTKEQIIDFVNRKMRRDNYVAVYKRQGEDKNIVRMPKPEITPILTNRDKQSAFLQEVMATEVQPIEPVFVDFERDMSRLETANGVEVLYKENETTDLFSLYYVFDFGKTDDPEMDLALSYMSYLGTESQTAEQIAAEMYGIACSYSFHITDDKAMVVISGLSENMAEAMEVTESLMAGAVANDQILTMLKYDVLKGRADSKLQQAASFNALRRYATYGPEYIKAVTVSNERLVNLTSEELLAKVASLAGIKHTIFYYGPQGEKELLANLNAHHKCAEELVEYPVKNDFLPLPTDGNRVVVAHYESPQIYYSQVSNLGGEYNPEEDAVLTLYNQYFGGGMNSIVFQEMREARGLAYSSAASMSCPSRLGKPYTYSAFIATQNDKMAQAMAAFSEIIEQMPESEAAFQLAKESLIANYRTSRTTKTAVLNAYMAASELGIDYDRAEKIYAALQTLTLEDVKAYQQSRVKGLDYTYMILGDTDDIDMKYLSSVGTVEKVSAEEIFGY